MSKGLIAVILGVLAVGLIAGCGSSDSSSSLTKAEFIKQGDAICEKVHKKIEDEFSVLLKKGSLKGGGGNKAVEEFTATKLTPILRSEAEELRDLGAPSGEEDAVNAILDPFEEGLEELESPSATASTNPVGINEANTQAKKYGLKFCVTS